MLILVCIALVLVALLFTAKFAIDGSFYKRLAQDAINKTTSLSLSIDGDFSLAWSLRPTVAASNLTLRNPEWPDDTMVARVKELELDLQLLPLLQGKLQLGATIKQPEVWLRIDDAGRTNWAETKATLRNDASSGIELEIEEAIITDAVFHYADPARHRDLSMQIKQAVFDKLGKQLDIDVQLSGEVDSWQIMVKGGLRRKAGARALEFDAVAGARAHAAKQVLQISDAPIQAQLNGKLSFHDGFDLDAHVDLMMQNLQSAVGDQASLPPRIAQLGPLSASGRVLRKQNKFRIVDVESRLKTAELDITASGEISRLQPDLNLLLDINTRATDLSPFSEFLDGAFWSDVGPVAGKARFHLDGPRYWLDNIEATARRKGMVVYLTGALPALFPSPKYQLRLEGEARDLSEIHHDLPPVGPVTAQANLDGIEDRFEISQLKAVVGKSDVSGNVKISLADKPKFSAQLRSNRLQLSDFFPDAADNQSENVENDTSSPVNRDQAPSIFSKTALELDWLNSINGDVVFLIDQLELEEASEENLRYTGELKEGQLFLTNTFGARQQGIEYSTLSLDARDPVVKLRLRKDIHGISVTELLNLEPGVVDGGTTNGFMEIAAQGHSIWEIMHNLNGEVLLQVDKARIFENSLSAVASDVSTAFLRGITPSDDQETATDFNCGVVGVTIKDGVVKVDNTFALESKRFNIGGGGTINLRKETVNIELRPRAKKGLGISLATITGGFKISGKLSAPSAGLSLKGLFESYLKSSTAVLLLTQGAAAVTTSAVVVVRGLWDRATSRRFSCNNTLKRFEKQRRRAVAVETGTQSGSTFEDEYFDDI